MRLNKVKPLEMSDIRQFTLAACIFVVKQITTGNSPVSVGYRLVSSKVGKAFGISKRFAYFCAHAIRVNV